MIESDHMSLEGEIRREKKKEQQNRRLHKKQVTKEIQDEESVIEYRQKLERAKFRAKGVEEKLKELNKILEGAIRRKTFTITEERKGRDRGW